jgi:membrane protein YdbS with pleckstrin-like domain
MQHGGMTETLTPDTPSPEKQTPPEPTPVRLRPPRHRVEKKAILLWTLHAVAGTFWVCGGLGLTYWLWEDSRPWLGPVLWILAVIYFVNITIMPTWRYLVHRWEVTDEAVYALNGWLTREWRITPISRIQSIDTTRGPLAQVMGLATLKVTTAARQGSITIAGVDAEMVAEVAERLTAITQQTPGDAT